MGNAEENSENLIQNYISQIKNLHIKFEKFFYESQESIHNFTKFKKEISRLKSDFNFLLLSKSIQNYSTPDKINSKIKNDQFFPDNYDQNDEIKIGNKIILL